MRIGVDFDNTIVCFDALFYQEALSQGLIPSDVEPTKSGVREAFRSRGLNDEWTRLQGIVYGEKIQEAPSYPGVKEFFRFFRSRGDDLVIISHKTQKPAIGKDLDLHRAARAWLDQQGFHSDLLVDPSRAFFEPTIEKKIDRIAKESCDVFIDDLLEFLLNPGFPVKTDRILFSPHGVQPQLPFRQATSWKQIQTLLN